MWPNPQFSVKIWPHLLKQLKIENFIFGSVECNIGDKICQDNSYAFNS